ncbi:MAG: hypothetical protein NDI69_06460 [Bacteriovoracaceae bacterium]|nr:hypothetical protein [Bacteriovoracaceae bacterium]
MKIWFLAVTLFLSSVQVFASAGSTIDLSKINNLMCRSRAIGGFYLAGLNSKNPLYFGQSKSVITVEKRTKNTLTFKYRDHEGYRFTVKLNKTVEHDEKESVHEGVFINGDIESPIECIAE